MDNRPMTRLYTKILAGQIPEPVPATQHLGQSSDSEDGTKPEKRKRGSSEEDPHYDPEMELTPPAGTTPNRRVDHKAAIVEDARRRAAHKSPSEGACLVTGFRDKSIQCCHVVQRATYHSELKHLERSWALKEVFSLDSHLNLLFLRADIHILWDRGYIAFIPEPQVVEKCYKGSIVPIGVDLSCNDPLEVSKSPVYKYCIVVSSDLPQSEENTAFPRKLETSGWFKSHAPPQFFIYNIGSKLSKGDGGAAFLLSLDTFYKRHKIGYQAKLVFSHIEKAFSRWSTARRRQDNGLCS
ncbi:predicted protein [Postia placenta Mad-698-R]|uniref:HNH nuclease domain-containing protein n=1 Tax=Postia placenta MAD-698-R-SB12 TaxID=670580 RepID=A0A1X6N1Q3_9APHY|nr:hypothetical protein POSPLADRAFT_1142019 [Postia placenta MAD-698-R-SB12]EED79075.1 predicted protein [Postia placenta Mad-698-R]OSX62524.1 hypothetical protein POSPLADRAFT_1142019 [Postia placenta MAD-698-R-SB12]